MDDGPLALTRAAAHFDADGLHHSFARACPVARRLVDVPAVQTGGAVVAMLGSPRLSGDLQFAVHTRKTIRLVSALMLKCCHWLMTCPPVIMLTGVRKKVACVQKMPRANNSLRARQARRPRNQQRVQLRNSLRVWLRDSLIVWFSFWERAKRRVWLGNGSHQPHDSPARLCCCCACLKRGCCGGEEEG